MKTLFFSFLLLTISFAHSQDLKNSNWVKILTEKKDGSQINEKLPGEALDGFFFKDSTVLTSSNDQLINELNYHVENGVLILGNFLQYNIDTVNDIVLKLTEIPHKSVPDNEINTYAFIKSKYLFEYLKENNQIQILGDTLIQCTRNFAPEYSKDDLRAVLRTPFKYHQDSVSFSGYFIIDPNNKINIVHLNPSPSVREREATAFEKLLKKTSKSWILPITDKPYFLKMDFYCFFKTNPNFHAFGGEFYTANIKFDPE